MTDDELTDIVRQLPADVILSLAIEHVRLVTEVLERDKEAAQAHTRGDIATARKRIEECVGHVQYSIYNAMRGGGRRLWGGGGGGSVFSLAAITDASHFARHGHRHWLTALDSDKLPVPAVDIRRAIIEGRSAAILDLFGRTNGGRKKVAQDIARKLNRAGFFTKRRHEPVKASTVGDWLTYIRKHNASKARVKAAAPHAEARRHWFVQDKPPLAELGYKKALELLEHDTKIFISGLVGSDPRRVRDPT